MPGVVATTVEANKRLLTPEALAQADPETARKEAFALAMANTPKRMNTKGQELINRDSYDAEVVSGRERKVKFDDKAPVLHDVESPLTLKAGEVTRYRLNEGSNVDLLSDDAVVETFWTENYRVDGWQGDQAVETTESMVYLRAKKPGKGKLRLIDSTWGNVDLDVIVK